MYQNFSITAFFYYIVFWYTIQLINVSDVKPRYLFYYIFFIFLQILGKQLSIIINKSNHYYFI